MSKIGENSNDKMPSGKTLQHDRMVGGGDGRAGSVKGDADASGGQTDADIENQAGTESADPSKFERDKAEGEDNEGSDLKP